MADVTALPLEYWLCAVLIVVAGLFALRQRHLLWVPPFIATLATVFAWYMIEPVYYEDFLLIFPPDAIAAGYRCLFVFLIALILATPMAVQALQPKAGHAATREYSITPEQVVPRIVILWLILLAYGVFRMDGNVISALFPIESRTSGSMWSRDAAEGAGDTGFIVSAAGYLYVLVLSAFGLLLPITRKPTVRWLLVLCILLSWPYALLQGSRNVTLAVITPALIAYLLLARKPLAMKAAVGIAAFIIVDLVMRAIIEFRDVGFGSATFRNIEEAKHLGLNMASELVYIANFVGGGTMDISWGWDYLVELMNVVPRALWANKPLIGIDYAIARGFGGGESDIGVFATLSPGLVGQGVMNFGLWFGPLAAGCLMALWVGILNRLRYQGGAARTGLFLVGIGLTFNLGRGITLLTLFPFVFGYFGILMLEARDKRMRAQIHREEQGLLVSSERVLGRRPASSD
jgi:oligosaccharide repeat unit polymerase